MDSFWYLYIVLILHHRGPVAEDDDSMTEDDESGGTEEPHTFSQVISFGSQLMVKLRKPEEMLGQHRN